MNDASDAQTPIFLLTALHQRFPQFSEKDAAKGVWKQQDANEAWLAICQFLQQLKGTGVNHFGNNFKNIENSNGTYRDKR